MDTDRYRQLEEENLRLKTELKRLRCESAGAPHNSPLKDDEKQPIELPKLPAKGADYQLTNDEISRYARQMTLNKFGVEGEKKLMSSSVLIVGAGGLGSPVFMYLVGTGIGRIGIADGDDVEISNIHRQVAHDTMRAGINKAISAKWIGERINPNTHIVAYPHRITPTNALPIVKQYDLVIDATDSVTARYIVNDACVIAGKPLISAGIVRINGQLSVYNYAGGPCYRCAHMVPPPPESVQKADTAGVLGPAVGVMGCLEAVEALKILSGIGSPLSSRLFIYDGGSCTVRVAKMGGKKPGCPVCGENRTITDPAKYDYDGFCGTAALVEDPALVEVMGITSGDYKRMREEGVDHVLVDVRSDSEFGMCAIDRDPERVYRAPALFFEDRIEDMREKFGVEKKLVLICRKGTLSYRAAKTLRNNGFKNAFYVIGGLVAWAKEVDTSFPSY